MKVILYIWICIAMAVCGILVCFNNPIYSFTAVNIAHFSGIALGYLRWKDNKNVLEKW
jgi:hypothetical protein